MSVPAAFIFTVGTEEHLYKFPWHCVKEFSCVSYYLLTALSSAVWICHRSFLNHTIMPFAQTVLKGPIRGDIRVKLIHAFLIITFTLKKKCKIISWILLEVRLLGLPFVEVEEKKAGRAILWLPCTSSHGAKANFEFHLHVCRLH